MQVIADLENTEIHVNAELNDGASGNGSGVVEDVHRSE